MKSLILFRFFELHILVLATLEPMVIATTDYLITRNSTQDHITTLVVLGFCAVAAVVTSIHSHFFD